MTPIVKLVFGIDYDKTRLAEFSSALSHARTQGIARGSFTPWIERHVGGLKGVVQAERAARRPEQTAEEGESRAIKRARSITPIAVVNMPGDGEFVVLVARRIDADHVGVIGQAVDDALLAKALRKLSA